MLPRYRVKFNPAKSKGVFAISLVETPAMEEEFLALAKQEHIQLNTISEEKRILLGLVLEPNKPVFRSDEKRGDFTIEFEAETVKELAYNFLKSGYQTNSTIEHDKNRIEGVSFVESWIVDDPEKDKSAAYGLSYPSGSWLAVMKVDSDEVWNDVKNGKVKGFSIDAMTELEKIDLKSITMSDEKKELTGWDMVKQGLTEIIGLSKKETEEKEDKQEEVTLGSLMTVGENPVKLNFEGEMLAVGDSVWIEGEGEERVPAPVGEHLLENDQTLVVTEEGIAAEIKEASVEEEVKEELETEAPAPAPEAAPTKDELESMIKSVLIKYAEEKEEAEKVELKKRTDKVEALEKEITQLKEEVVKLKAEPAATPTKTVPVDFSKMTELQKRKYWRQNAS